MTTTDIATYIQAITWEDVIDALGVALVFLLAYSPFASKLHTLVTQWQVYAATTPTPHDDRIARGLRGFTGAVRAVLAFGVKWIPRLTVGLATLRATTDAATTDAATAKARARRSTPFIGMLVIALVVLSGCAGADAVRIRRAQTGVSSGLLVMKVVDDVFAPRLRAARLRIEAGDIPEAELAVYRRRWVTAGLSVTSTVTALHVAETRLATIKAEFESNPTLPGVAERVASIMACVSVGLQRVLDELPKVGVMLATDLDAVLQIAIGLAGSTGECDQAAFLAVEGESS